MFDTAGNANGERRVRRTLVIGKMHVMEQSGLSRFCCSKTRLEYSGRHRREIYKSKFLLTKPTSTLQTSRLGVPHCLPVL